MSWAHKLLARNKSPEEGGELLPPSARRRSLNTSRPDLPRHCSVAARADDEAGTAFDPWLAANRNIPRRTPYRILLEPPSGVMPKPSNLSRRGRGQP